MAVAVTTPALGEGDEAELLALEAEILRNCANYFKNAGYASVGNQFALKVITRLASLTAAHRCPLRSKAPSAQIKREHRTAGTPRKQT